MKVKLNNRSRWFRPSFIGNYYYYEVYCLKRKVSAPKRPKDSKALCPLSFFSILNRALSWAITSFGNKFCLKKRSRLIKALDNRFYVKFMQLE